MCEAPRVYYVIMYIMYYVCATDTNARGAIEENYVLWHFEVLIGTPRLNVSVRSTTRSTMLGLFYRLWYVRSFSFLFFSLL